MKRSDLDHAFSHGGKLRAPPMSGIARELWDLQFYAPPRPDPASLPSGEGRAVLVIPALLTDDWYTKGLRTYLSRCGFLAFASKLGPNWGPTPKIRDKLRKRVADIRSRVGMTINLIGISMGGLLARDLAFDYPNDIAHVVTIGSPITLPAASNLEGLIRLCAPFYSDDIDLARLGRPLPVPWTSIYSKRDGIIDWRSCLAEETGGVCIEVDAPHLAMARNPDALRSLITRLADTTHSS